MIYVIRGFEVEEKMPNDADEFVRHQKELIQADLDFLEENSRIWTNAIHQSFGENPPTSVFWSKMFGFFDKIIPFIGKNLNHTMLPDRGGLDMKYIEKYHEDNFLSFIPDKDVNYIYKFDNAHFEYIEESPVDSFFLVEAGFVEKTDVYDEVNGCSEELVEVEEGYYVNRSVWESRFYFNSKKGEYVNLPDEAKLIKRYLRGKFLIVAKASLWNRDNSTYDGRHNRMSALKIRQTINRAIQEGARR